MLLRPWEAWPRTTVVVSPDLVCWLLEERVFEAEGHTAPHAVLVHLLWCDNTYRNPPSCDAAIWE